MSQKEPSPDSPPGREPRGPQSETLPLEALLEAVDRVRPIIEDHAAQSESQRALADPVYDAMLDEGLFRAWAPRVFGGLELHPVDAYQVWEAIARIDSAAAWCLQISSAISGFARWLPKGGGEEIFERGPDTIFAGGFFPAGPSIRVEGGWRVTSRTAFASGCHRAQWFVVPILEVNDKQPLFDPKREDAPSIGAFVPRDEVDIIDTWHTVGMRGTFSADVNVDDVFVPDDRVAHIEADADRAGPHPVRTPATRTGLRGGPLLRTGAGSSRPLRSASRRSLRRG